MITSSRTIFDPIDINFQKKIKFWSHPSYDVFLCARSLYINAGMEGSSLSSPLESPDVPITSSVVTLQSAESLSMRQQVRLNSGHCSQPVVIPCLPALTQFNTLNKCSSPAPLNQVSLTQTPDSPSANVSSTTSENSQAFSSHFNSQTNLLSQSHPPFNAPSPTLLTPSPDFSSDSENKYFEEFEFLRYSGDPWNFSNFDYDLISLNFDDTSTKSINSDWVDMVDWIQVLPLFLRNCT